MPKTNNNQFTVIGVDIGGTKIHAALYKFSKDFFKDQAPCIPGEVCHLFKKNELMVKDQKIPTNASEGFNKVIENVLKLIEQLRDENTIAVGIGIPGYVDSKKGIVHRIPNIPHEGHVNVQKYFTQKLDLPVYIGNDANLFGFAEYHMDWKGKIKDMLAFTLGTGLGGAIIINGELYEGSQGFAGEFGHVAFNEDQELEDIASGKNLQKETRGKSLGIVISNFIHIFNPSVIALGGGMAEGEFQYMEADMWKEIKKRTVPESNKNLKIYVSKLVNPGTLGAAIMAYYKTNIDKLSKNS